MPLISFSTAKESVCNGTKGMTIRALRKRPFEVGDILYLWWKSSTNERKLLRGDFCCYEQVLKWWQIEELPSDKREYLAELDGFSDWKEMEAWFKNTYGENFHMGKWFQIVCWNFRTESYLRQIFSSKPLRCLD